MRAAVSSRACHISRVIFFFRFLALWGALRFFLAAGEDGLACFFLTTGEDGLLCFFLPVGKEGLPGLAPLLLVPDTPYYRLVEALSKLEFCNIYFISGDVKPG
jgi:hypothetical protein